MPGRIGEHSFAVELAAVCRPRIESHSVPELLVAAPRLGVVPGGTSSPRPTPDRGRGRSIWPDQIPISQASSAWTASAARLPETSAPWMEAVSR